MKINNTASRRFILAAIVVAVATWDIAFNFGAFKVIFFEKFFLVWVISIAILLADIALDNKRILKGWSLVAMLAPTAMMGVTVWSYYIGEASSFISTAFFFLSTIVTVFLLPYAAYIIISVTQADMLKIKSKRLLWWLVAIAAIVGALGFSIGHFNRYFLSCESFKISGNDLPDNCYQQERPLRERL